MADFNNLSEINENFNTIKTLLNSIRAQGILNTSDVDKLLTGINTKLERINTEEDIDLIKIFLSELKQNLDERHSVLISKFGAIESLFSNLLKNSSEMPKSAELKELFDIVATNLSVFSREVVSQKESLTDITLRLDALRSDDSQKKEIIKNIGLLKPDLERLNNGFDSIVLSLNDNFKTIVKTISTLDKTDYLDKFADVLTGMEMSSNTILSALQMLDKKTEQVEAALQNLATQDDIASAKERLFELTAQSHELTASVSDLGSRYLKIDNLAEKIDASVNIIASLKSVLEEADNQNTALILDKLKELESEVKTISSDTKFEEFRTGLQSILKNILDNTISVDTIVSSKTTEIIAEVNLAIQKIAALQDANITRVLNDLSTSADALNSKLAQTQSSISVLCEKNFNSVFDSITNIKTLIAQIDENSVSANNAIFSSITDRLTLFENSLKISLDTQEKNTAASSVKLFEQIENIKNLSSVLDYKMDSTVVESGNVKRELSALKESVDAVLALDFVNTVKDLRVDLYASKQEMMNTFETSNNELSEKFINDLYGKYELLISKLDSVEDEIKKTQSNSLSTLKILLENISSSIVDVLSYVGEQRVVSDNGLNSKLDEITNIVHENSINYVEGIRDVVEVVRIQVDNNLRSLEKTTAEQLAAVNKTVFENSKDLKENIQNSYSKLIEIQDSYKEIKDIINLNSINSSSKIDGIIASAQEVKSDFESSIISLKAILLDKITEFKQELTCANNDKVSELKFAVENTFNKNSQEVSNLLTELMVLMGNFTAEDNNTRAASLAKILDNFVSLKNYLATLNDNYAAALSKQVDVILDDFKNVKFVLNKIDENIDGDMTRQLSIIESNFESLVSQITILFDKSDKALTEKINREFELISTEVQSSIAEKLEGYKLKIEESFDKLQADAQAQSGYLQERVADLNTALRSVLEEQHENNYKQISEIAVTLKGVIDDNIKLTAIDYISFKEKLEEFAKDIETKNSLLTQDLKAQLDDITKYIDSIMVIQNDEQEARQTDFIKKQKEITDKIETSKTETLRTMAELSVVTAEQLEELKTETLNAINLVKNTNENEFTSVKNIKNDIAELSRLVSNNKELLSNLDSTIISKVSDLSSMTAEISAGELQTLDSYVNTILEQIELEKQTVKTCKDLVTEFTKKELDLISKNIEKETDIILGELVEQFDLIKQAQADDNEVLARKIEELISSEIYNNIEDLKSYLDVKTDTTVLHNKLDNIKIDMQSSVENINNSIEDLLDSKTFNTEVNNFKTAIELLLANSSNDLNDKLKEFLNDSTISLSELKEATHNKLEELAKVVDNSEIAVVSELQKLNECFEHLRSQISNKSFDEAFQASINKQIQGIEELISDQMSYIEDISELCSLNLPEVSELNIIVKHSVLESLNSLSEKLDNQDIEGNLEQEFKQFKTEIITQFLNVFNQISFIAEQEEILDFVSEKHDELITILSHIVTTSGEIENIKETVSVVDNKIDNLKEDIELINEKITAIMSSEGDIDYVYSLQDLESDIANLRIELNSMKENDHGEEFKNLINSTNDIYSLVESIKAEFPDKKDLEGIAEDIVSISTRTNKLILASDESYKTLQDNLQDFKLVINDLDERTRNFAQESGMDKVNAKLNAINTMMEKGAQTNQVFNQVFEYLAEWVDNASIQINSITDRVETLDEIGQIKDMLAELKAGAEDNTETVELIEALGEVFDKQTKRISSLEAKLDKIIVETTINNRNNKLDLTPMEETLNRFLVAMDEKMSFQQEKINSLEAKLAGALEIIEGKDTAQLTKKVGGMDRQIAKLNKSIEKIASHVIEK